MPAPRPTSPTPVSGGSVDRFRPRSRRPELHRQERWTLFWVALHLCFLPWALGTMHLWSQSVSLGLAVLGFVVAAQPRVYTDFFTAGDSVLVRPLQRLWRFPLFWCGLLALLYIVIQGLNPTWRYRVNTSYWWLEYAYPITWLPSGMEVPVQAAGPWRSLLVHASLWLTLCTVWIGIMRRQAFRLLFLALVVNGVLLALLGLAQQLTQATGIFWQVKVSSASFISSFIYRNHAGAYFNLLLALAAGLAWWSFVRSNRRFEKSSPAGVFVFAAAVIGTMVLFSLSRGSILTMVVLAGSVGLAFVFAQTREPAHQRNNLALLLLFGLVAVFVGVGLYSLKVEKVVARFEDLIEDPVASAADRTAAHTAAAKMLAARPLLGWGAGCFRYGFPDYARHHPEIYYAGTNTRRFWEHAHNDILQYPIEFGLVGLTPLVAGLAWLGWQLARRRFWANPLALPATIGAGLTVVHAWGDFVFQNPAVLLTWAVLLLAAGRWAELDQQSGDRETR